MRRRAAFMHQPCATKRAKAFLYARSVAHDVYDAKKARSPRLLTVSASSLNPADDAPGGVLYIHQRPSLAPLRSRHYHTFPTNYPAWCLLYALLPRGRVAPTAAPSDAEKPYRERVRREASTSPLSARASSSPKRLLLSSRVFRPKDMPPKKKAKGARVFAPSADIISAAATLATERLRNPVRESSEQRYSKNQRPFLDLMREAKAPLDDPALPFHHNDKRPASQDPVRLLKCLVMARCGRVADQSEGFEDWTASSTGNSIASGAFNLF